MLLVPARDQRDRLLEIDAVLGFCQDRMTIAGAQTFEKEIACMPRD